MRRFVIQKIINFIIHLIGEVSINNVKISYSDGFKGFGRPTFHRFD